MSDDDEELRERVMQAAADLRTVLDPSGFIGPRLDREDDLARLKILIRQYPDEARRHVADLDRP